MTSSAANTIVEHVPEHSSVEVLKPAHANQETKDPNPDKYVYSIANHQIEFMLPPFHIDASLARAAVATPLQTYLQVYASNSQNIAAQGRHVIQYWSNTGDTLWGNSTTTLASIENVQIMSWENPSEATNTYTKTYTVGFTTTTSTEVSAAIGLAPSFNGISLWNAEGGYKRVTAKETSNGTETSTSVQVPPRSNVYFYQRRYRFVTDVYFSLDAWREIWLVGSNGGYFVQRATIYSYIDAEEYLTSPTRLSGTTTAQFSSEAKWPGHSNVVRQFGNLTEPAKDKLRSIGINGNQQG